MLAQPEWLRRVPTDRRLPAGARVVYTGCGTSFHAAQTGGWAVQALEAVLEPPRADIMVCVSHEGGTELTIEAERAFGGDVWLVTGSAESPLAELADEVIVCTPELERSWCHTASYTCAVAAIAGAARRGDRLAAGARSRRRCSRRPSRSGRSACSSRRRAGTGRPRRRRCSSCARAHGSMPARIETEQLLHGHLAAVDEHGPGVRARGRGARGRARADAVRALEELGCETTARADDAIPWSTSSASSC